MQLNQSIANHAARTQRAYSVALEKQTEAKDKLAVLVSRVAALKDERSKIIKARTNGNADSEQETRLVVLAADMEGLEPLVSAAKQEFEALNPQRTHRNCQEAKEQWRQHQIEVSLAELNDRCKEVEALLITMVQKILDTGRETGRSQRLSDFWKPSNELERLIKFNHLVGRLGS